MFYLVNDRRERRGIPLWRTTKKHNSRQSKDELDAKSFKISDVYREDTFNNVFIEDVDSFIRHSLRNTGKNPQADLTNFSFQTESL